MVIGKMIAAYNPEGGNCCCQRIGDGSYRNSPLGFGIVFPVT